MPAMRHLWAALFAGLVTLIVAWPVSSAAPAEDAGGAAKILVLPFAPINPAEPEPWLGKSIQQSVVADLAVAVPGRVVSTDAAMADAAAGVEAAKRAGASYVVRGNFATVGHALRVTGQVLDANTGKPVAAIKATGPTAEVFTLEDELAAQIRRRLVLSPPRAANQAGAAAAGESVPPMEPLRVPQSRQSADPYVQAYITPLDASSSPDRRQLDDDYYFGQPGGSPYLIGGYGIGLGLRLGSNYYGGFGACWGSSNAWGGRTGGNGWHGAGGVNPTAGTAIAPGVVFHPTSHASVGRAGGGGRR
jgi:TolB-like protein